MLIVFIAFSATIADDETDETEKEPEEKDEKTETQDRKERSVLTNYDPAIMAPEMNADAGLLFRRKIRSEEGCCCC
ncbi:hypothetical protein QQG55_45650 [Brugia pahangi]